jgi:hypothetical protein
MKKSLLVFVLVLVLAVPAFAKTTIDIGQIPSQEDFKKFSTDFGLAISYQPLAAAAPLGDKLPGFDVGVEASFVKLDRGAPYFAAFTGDVHGTLVLPRLHAQVGLPFIPIDFGLSYTSVPNSDIKLTGYEIKYAIVKGNAVLPAIAVRAAYTTLTGVDILDMSTKSVDLSISKGILILTPYAGIGQVWITSKAAGAFEKEDITETRGFVGLKTKIFPFINLVLEGDFSTVNVYSARLNVNF